MEKYKSNLRPAVILSGFVAFVTQVILLREFLTFFNGNELVIGVILANWMLLTGLGAYLARFIKNNAKITELILILLGSLAFIPVITVLELHYLSRLFFNPGVMHGITHVFYYSLLILSPFCIISGMLFTLFTGTFKDLSQDNRIGVIYAWESIGSMIGGLVLNFVLIWFLSTFQSLYVVMILIVFVTVFLSIKNQKLLISGGLVFVFLLFSFLFLQNNLDKSIRELSFPGQMVQYIDETPYGILAITSQDGQVNYFENNVLMATSGDVAFREESAHFAMVQHKNPESVLVLSGIVSGIMNEIKKYPVKQIDYVDVNPGIIRIAREYFNEESSGNVNLIKKDAIRYLKKTDKKYDVVIIHLPKPSTIQFNRFYTKEFFSLLKSKLNKNAIISLSLPSSSNYLNDEARKLISIVHATLKTQFKNILILPGTDDFILASDDNLSGDIAKQIQLKNISTEYVNSFYIHDELVIERSKKIMNLIDLNAPVNTDFNPVCYQSQIKLWLSHFNLRYWIPAVLIILFAGFFYIRANSLNKAVFAAGFAGTSIEIVLLLVFQVLYGYVYFAAGIFIMIFMAGLALGSLYWQKVFKQNTFKGLGKLQILVAVFALILPVLFYFLKTIETNERIFFLVFIILLLLISILTGAIFSVSTSLNKDHIEKTASDAYGIDLIGAATGALFFSIYLVPILGFGFSLVFIALLSSLSAYFVLRKA
ncbi:MAG: hypothetical protein A2X13_05495 [Bacteroidetes bacterium GWC2_33_15]|nr:MAG: hypothetical protein A2X10_12140 [Bacteroidetes bacterium GWA2_33_15]OFX51917.1 MAG: hypothetical protein A2X13_05495 [Bacteroidetes bacterium GWC2_33_15]OFX63485.1 MAG: hypothetical protein A2X15_01770 [Bacteroidetes bacterium GWB2_32_14]OFX67167.1 MAG: hypothetical protein A2X14_00980 [Bacteroidetes bacterium GWD2_33_33]HAN17112.1 hypothetical protein [Bacteroidales bacterium]